MVTEERISDQQVDIHESSSSGEINLEQVRALQRVCRYHVV